MSAKIQKIVSSLDETNHTYRCKIRRQTTKMRSKQLRESLLIAEKLRAINQTMLLFPDNSVDVDLWCTELIQRLEDFDQNLSVKSITFQMLLMHIGERCSELKLRALLLLLNFNEQMLDQMLVRHNILSLIQTILKSSTEFELQKTAILLLSVICSRSPVLKQKTIDMRMLEIVQCLSDSYPYEFYKLQQQLFAVLTVKPIRNLNGSVVYTMVRRRVGQLFSQHTDLHILIQSLQNCLKWKNTYVFKTLHELKIVDQLLKLGEIGVDFTALQLINKTIIQLVEWSQNKFGQLKGYQERFADFTIAILKAQQPALNQAKRDCLFVITNAIYQQVMFVLRPLFAKGFLGVLSTMVVEQRDQDLLYQVFYCLNTYLNSMEETEEKLIQCRLVDNLLEKSKAFKLYGSAAVGMLIKVFSKLIAYPKLLRICQSKKSFQQLIQNQPRQIHKAAWETLESHLFDEQFE